MKPKSSSPSEHYQREKERRQRSGLPDSEAIAAAKLEYQALLKAQAEKGKGGRPKKKPVKPADADEIPASDEESDAEEI